VPGQIRQGGKKLRYEDGYADYFRDVLNTTNPYERFEPDHSKGQTYSDMDFAKLAWESYRPTEQDGMWVDYLRELRYRLVRSDDMYVTVCMWVVGAVCDGAHVTQKLRLLLLMCSLL